VQLVGIDEGAVDVENESARMGQKDSRKSIKQVHVLELKRLSVMKCGDSRRSFHFVSRSLPLGSTASRRGFTGQVAAPRSSIECRSLPRCFTGDAP
jgi:hypothetical protein